MLALTGGLIATGATPALAHGIGGRSDLPLDLTFFQVGAGVVLVVSFIALAVLWPTPRLQDGPRPRVLSARWPAALSGVLRVLGVGALLLAIVAGLFGEDDGARNITPVLVYVLVWLVVPFGSAVLGNWWAAINPWDTLSRLVPLDEERPDVPARWGVYPAAVAFVGFTWLELVYPDNSSPRVLGVATLVYTFYALGMAAAGRSGLASGELFTVYNRLISAIAPFGRDEQGRLLWRGWLRALPVLPAWRGLALLVVAMIGTVTFDGLSATPWWRERVEALGVSADSMATGTAGLVLVVAVIGIAYVAASWLAVRLAGGGSPARVMVRFAHTLVPIALAYAVAHYFTLIIFEGQLLYIHASDPFGLGWNLFGTADWRVQFWLAPTAIWYVQVVAIVTGHVCGVVLAHDRALADFEPEVAVRSQYAMLMLMVLLTGLGLAILAAG